MAVIIQITLPVRDQVVKRITVETVAIPRGYAGTTRPNYVATQLNYVARFRNFRRSDTIFSFMVNDGEITSAPKLLTTRELAQYLQMTVRTLRRHIDGGMPVIRMNRRVYRFDLVRVRAWLDEQS